MLVMLLARMPCPGIAQEWQANQKSLHIVWKTLCHEFARRYSSDVGSCADIKQRLVAISKSVMSWQVMLPRQSVSSGGTDHLQLLWGRVSTLRISQPAALPADRDPPPPPLSSQLLGPDDLSRLTGQQPTSAQQRAVPALWP